MTEHFLTDSQLGAMSGYGREGWSPFGPVLTTAELDALPVASCVIDQFGDILQKHNDQLWHSYETRPMPAVKVAKWGARLYGTALR